MVLAIVVTVIACYLLGNLNGAVFVSHCLHDDVRSHGSGNAGLTNFVRNYGPGWAAVVVIIDAGKAVLACLLGSFLFASFDLRLEGMTLGGLAVMAGHDFPALLDFRGGKGILSGFAVALMIDWRIGVLILAVFLGAYLLSGYVSLGSVLASAAFGAGFVLFHYDNLWVMTGGILMAALAIFMHRSNISRLIKGQERKTNLLKRGSGK